jgi:DNA-binding GntR family transcriptional regulator
LKRIFEGCFLLKYHQNPQALKEMEHRKKREKVLKKERKKEKEKLQESLQIKGEVNILRGENIATSKSFLYEPIFFPSIIPFQKPFPKSFEKILQLFLDHPLTWQHT